MRKTFWLLASAGLAALLTIVWIIYVGRALGPREYSEFSTALSLVYFFAIVLSPLTPALARVVAKRAAHGNEAVVHSFRRSVMRILAGVAVAAAPVVVLAAIGLARLLRFSSFVPLLLAFSSALAFSILSADRGVLQGLFRFPVYNASVLTEAIVRLAVTIVAFRISATPSVALGAYLAAIVAAELLIVSFAGLRSAGLHDHSAEWLELRALAVPMLTLMIAAAVFQNLDMFAVKRWFDPVTAGHYGAALALARAFGVLFTPLWVLIGPVLTRLHGSGRPIVPASLRFAGGYLALSALPLLALGFAGEPIIILLFGADYAPGWWIAAHLGAVSVLIHLSLLVSQVFVTLHDFRFLRAFIAAVVLEVMALALFHESLFQVLGCLYAAQLALAVPLVHRLWITRRSHD